MKQLVIYAMICVLPFIACTKNEAAAPQHAFSVSRLEAAERINRFRGSDSQRITPELISTVSYIHTPAKSFAFVFYETASGSRNLVITRTYTAKGIIDSESVTTCDGTCGCQVQASIDNQGNVKVGCSCTNCALVIH